MATVFTHAVVALAASRGLAPKPYSRRVAFCAVVCSLLPDVDVLSFIAGIPYHHWLGHRGFTHSLLFALLLSIAVDRLVFRATMPAASRLRIFLLTFSVTASHGVLDAMTDGGHGIAFFAPFDNTRYFLPVTPIRVSPIGLSFFSPRGLEVLASEVFWVWLPLGTIGLAAAVAGRWLSPRTGPANRSN